jgi:hypothetical protein
VAPRFFGASLKTDPPTPVEKPRSATIFGLTLASVVVAATALIAAIALLVIVSRPAPVAAAFTRVGGTSQVETAVDASRFWLTPPQLVVETPANARERVMLGAAHCAMVNDAPLLFTSTNHKRRRLVQATTYNWWGKAAKHHTRPIMDRKQVKTCLKNAARKPPVKVTGLSVLQVPSQQRQLSGLQLTLPVQPMLASFVVFAAPIAPRHEPDVAVGLAVAEHLAKADGEQVSLVVIQRYLEADPQLEKRLRTQPALVKGGIVLGQTPTVTADTRALLRRLLTTADQQSLLNQIQATLGSAGPLIAALLALVGLGAAAALAAPTIIALGTSEIRELLAGQQSTVTTGTDVVTSISLYTRAQQAGQRLRRYVMVKLGMLLAQPTPKAAEWLDALTADELKQEVTVTISLRSGWTVTGTVADPDNYKGRNVAVWRINTATLGQDGSPREKAHYVLVPVMDIELIRVNDPN